MFRAPPKYLGGFTNPNNECTIIGEIPQTSPHLTFALFHFCQKMGSHFCWPLSVTNPPNKTLHFFWACTFTIAFSSWNDHWIHLQQMDYQVRWHLSKQISHRLWLSQVGTNAVSSLKSVLSTMDGKMGEMEQAMQAPKDIGFTQPGCNLGPKGSMGLVYLRTFVRWCFFLMVNV